MIKPQQDAPSLIEQAAKWIVNMSAGEISTEQRRAFESWLAQDPRHREVYKQAEHFWQTSTMPLQDSPPVALKRRMNKPTDGRTPLAITWIIGAALALLTIILVIATAYVTSLNEWLADEPTRIGEIRQISLADGSTLTLDSGSSVNITFSDNERRVILRGGRLLVDGAPDNAVNKRVFLVENRDGVFQAQDAQYVVEQAEKDTVISVIKSHVMGASYGRADQSLNLKTDQGVRFDRRHVSQPEAVLRSASSWAHARLVFEVCRFIR